jgi:hypothetical protein
MRFLTGSLTVAILCVVSVAPSKGQSINKSPLNGGPPVGFNVLPPLPPTGFYAWCGTAQGLCLVQGNAPIAPGSTCHCAQYEGRTA